MFYLFYGMDTEKARAKMHGVLEAAKKKRKEAEIFRMDSENFRAADLEEKIIGQGLFEKKFIVVLDGIMESKPAAKEIIGRLKEMKETENLFLVLERKLNKPELDKLEKFAEKIYAFSDTAPAKKEFNNFAIADALAKRDRKNFWVLYRQAVEKGASPEEICGILFWKLKTMATASYPQKFSKEEIKAMLGTLVSAYHNAHRGLCDFENTLEKFVLSV